jgi:drug/metabolite transporter (DMT)-like permease
LIKQRSIALSTTENSHSKGLLIAAIGGMALTIDIPLIRLAQGETWSILMVRSGTTFIAALVVWAIWRMAAPATAPRLIPGRAGLVVSALYGLASVTFVLGIFNTLTANLVFILAFNPMFTALLSWIFLKERPGPATFATMAVMVIGVGIIVGGSLGSGHVFGDLMGLSTALLLSGAITITRASGKDMGFAALVSGIAPCIIAMFVVWNAGYMIESPWWAILDGIIIMPISFFCLATAPKYIAGPEVAMFYLLETVLAPVWVWMVFSEMPARNSLIGGAILIVALVFHSMWQLHQGRKRRIARAVRQPA